MIIESVSVTGFTAGEWSGILAQVTDNAGRTGFGLGPVRAAALARELADQALVGWDARGTLAAWHRMLDQLERRSWPNFGSEAAAALDFAMWDLRAKGGSEPLWKTLGGSRPAARSHLFAGPADASRLSSERSIEDIIGEFGFEAARLEMGFDLSADRETLERLVRVLQGANPHPSVLVSFGDRLTPPEAIAVLRALEDEHDLTAVLGDVAYWKEDGLRQVSAAARGAAGNAADAGPVSGFEPKLNSFALDLVQIDPCRRGVSGSLELADAAFGYELPVTLLQTPCNVGAHLAAAMPNFMSMEVAAPREESAIVADVRLIGGRAIAGDRPGLGLTVQKDILDA